MGTPLNQRPNNIFLSHSSRDKLPFVDGLYQWLTRTAGLRVWYDDNLGSGPVSSNLGLAVDSCQAAVVVLSESSVQSYCCLLYTSPSPRDRQKSRMPSSA